MNARLAPVRIAVLAVLFDVLVSAQGTLPSRGPRRVEILFLGHSAPSSGAGSADRLAPVLKAGLAQYGFNFSYTTDPADLNAANLASYDALMIDRGHATLAAAQEQAVLEFGTARVVYVESAACSFGAGVRCS